MQRSYEVYNHITYGPRLERSRPAPVLGKAFSDLDPEVIFKNMFLCDEKDDIRTYEQRIPSYRQQIEPESQKRFEVINPKEVDNLTYYQNISSYRLQKESEALKKLAIEVEKRPNLDDYSRISYQKVPSYRQQKEPEAQKKLEAIKVKELDMRQNIEENNRINYQKVPSYHQQKEPEAQKKLGAIKVKEPELEKKLETLKAKEKAEDIKAKGVDKQQNQEGYYRTFQQPISLYSIPKKPEAQNKVNKYQIREEEKERNIDKEAEGFIKRKLRNFGKLDT